jgi:hypothetical protein
MEPGKGEGAEALEERGGTVVASDVAVHTKT